MIKIPDFLVKKALAERIWPGEPNAASWLYNALRDENDSSHRKLRQKDKAALYASIMEFISELEGLAKEIKKTSSARTEEYEPAHSRQTNLFIKS